MPEDDQDWVRGPRRSGRGPVVASYIPGTLDRACPNCHAPRGEYCVHRNSLGDVLRRMPCPERLPHNTDTGGT